MREKKVDAQRWGRVASVVQKQRGAPAPEKVTEMSIYDKVKEAKIIGGGSYFEAGFDFVVAVTAVKHIDVRGNKEGAFIVETKVLSTNCATCQAGSERNWYVDCNQDAAANNLKQFGLAAGEAMFNREVDPATVDGAWLRALQDKQQPLVGKLLKTTTWNKDTQKGNPFTRHKWTGLLTPKEREAAVEAAKRLDHALAA